MHYRKNPWVFPNFPLFSPSHVLYFTLSFPAWLLRKTVASLCFWMVTPLPQKNQYVIFGPPKCHFIDHFLHPSIRWGATVTSKVTVSVPREPVCVWINCSCDLWGKTSTPFLLCPPSGKTGGRCVTFQQKILFSMDSEWGVCLQPTKAASVWFHES